MKEKKPDISLLNAYLQGHCSSAGEKLVEEWLADSPENIEVLEELATRNIPPNTISFNRTAVKESLFKSIEGDEAEELKISGKSGKQSNMSYLLRVAAVLLIFCSVSYALYWKFDESNAEQIFVEKISPARTVTAITLPDGSKVELNANSTLRFPENFSDGERLVYLEGEAFFIVSKEAERPFKVHTGNLTTTVLGTSFNVKHIPEMDKVDVALVEGKVSISALKKDSSYTNVILSPDEWISYSPTNRSLNIKQGVRNKILWREGILEFDGETLQQVIKDLEAWYGVKIIMKNTAFLDCSVQGTFKNESLENVLKGLQFVTGINYEINKDTVTVSGGRCG